MNLNLDLRVALIIFFLSFVGTIIQSAYIYDSFHWAVIQSSIDLNSGLLPYKDFFVHYGPLHTLINSIALYLSNYDLISTMVVSGLFFSLGNLVIFIISKKVFNFQLSLFIPVIVFLIHPFSNSPWPNYLFLFFISLSLFFYFRNKNYSFFMSGIFLSLSCLIYENFIFLSPLILVFLFLIDNKNFKNFLILFLGFIIPLFFFHIYLLVYDLHYYWFKTFNLNSVFLELNGSLTNLIIIFFKEFFERSFLNIFNESYFFIFFAIFSSNLYFLFLSFTKILKKENLSLKEKYLSIIAIVSILTLGSALHKLNIFRFSTGPILGILVSIHLIETYFNRFKNYIIFFFIAILFSSSFVPYKQENNKFFPNFEKIFFNSNQKDIRFFKSQRWSKDTWNFLLSVKQLNIKIKNNCKNTQSFLNYSKEGFLYMITKEYLSTNQYLYWYDRNKYFDELNKHFNINMDQLVEKSINLKNTLIYVDINNLNYLKKNFNLENYQIRDLPYSYEQKRIFFVLPKECNF